MLYFEDVHEASFEQLEWIIALAKMVTRLKGVALIVTSRNEPRGTSLGGALMLVGIGFSRRRKFGLGLLALGLTVTLVACPGDTPAPERRTYKLSLTAIGIQKAGSGATVSGLPLSGAIISVEK